MKKQQLSIRLNGKHVGILEQTQSESMRFTYDASATQAISIGMPIREEPYGEHPSEAYFGGLLPESELVRKVIGLKYRVSHNNNFSLLKVIGYDCAGAISCNGMDEPIIPHSSFPLTTRIVTEDELYTHIKELPKTPLFLGVDGLRLSLAGVQDKAAVCLIDDQIALAENGCPTTHILKPTSSHFKGLAENEYFCLRIAKQIGLAVPNIQLRQLKDINFLLIERYDRRIKNGHVERIHQEDFCQALGIVSSKKYQNEGGPSFKNCFDTLRNTTQPAVDRNQLASALVFNYLVCNMDSHGKNFSLLHHSQSNLRLAPLYDIVCTRAYPELSSKMAMRIGTKYDSDNVFPRHWEQLCKDISYRYLAMKDMIKEQSEFILEAAEKERDVLAASGWNVLSIDQVIGVIEKNINRTLDKFKV
ncbi:MAG: type II toxin-antitoxin system HipA family toxin [Gammaproteobacteria bacterium]